MPKQKYTIALTSTGDRQASFEVTRSIVGEENIRNDPLPYVQIRCSDGFGQDAAVQWGTWDSPTGWAALATSGSSCRAYVSTQPWHEKVNSNVVEFAP